MRSSTVRPLLACLAWFGSLLAGCQDPPAPPPDLSELGPPLYHPSWKGVTLESVLKSGAEAANLARFPDAVVELTVPDTVRRSDEPVDRMIPVRGPFEVVREVGEVVVYHAPLPVRLDRATSRGATKGVAIIGPVGRKLRHRSESEKGVRSNTWTFDDGQLVLRLDQDEPRPADGDYTFRSARAARYENALNLATADLSPVQYTFRQVEYRAMNRTGILLPPPGRLAWDLSVPEGTVLGFEGMVLPAEITPEHPSDGVEVRVEVEAGGSAEVVYETRLEVGGEWMAHRVDLSAWAGERIRLRLVTADRDRHLDYVFLAEPAVFVPREAPRRVVLCFLDTVRPDHLSLFGYERPTSPSLDAWAEQAVVFEDVHSVAPWTLPSARAVLGGRQPDGWSDHPHLAEELGRRGWVTAVVVDNTYLKSKFEMARGWGYHHYRNLDPASVILAEGEDLLAKYPDRDVLLMVQLMDAHLPYKEPVKYRRIWASDRPEALPKKFNRHKLADMEFTDQERAELRRYLVARYDQNILYLDKYLGRFLRARGPSDAVVVFSDHGEEFFEHDQYEHGHAFWEELLRVLLVMRLPGVAPARVEAPVSLLDITPTLYDLLGLRIETEGSSLLDLLAGDSEAASRRFRERVQVFSRPLYGRDAWGVIRDGQKALLRDGSWRRYALDADPKEQQDLGAPSRPEEALAVVAGALDRDLWPCLRLHTRVDRQPEPLTVRIERPGGFETFWRGYDPRDRYRAHPEEDESGAVVMKQKRRKRLPRELYLVADGGWDPEGVKITWKYGDEERVAEVEAGAECEEGKELLRVGDAERELVLDCVVVPGPAGEEMALDEEVEEELRLLGYLE